MFSENERHVRNCTKIKSRKGEKMKYFASSTIRRLGLAIGMTTLLSGAALADDPRPGGTLNLIAPYGASLSTLDIHATVRAQDDIVARSMHRSLYSWDSEAGKPRLELASSVDVSEDRLTYTYTLRDDVYFHNGRQLSSDDIIWSYTRIMSPEKGYPGARFIRIIEGAVAVEEGSATEISGLRKIDDLTFEVKLAEATDPGFALFRGTTSILPREEVEKGDAFTQSPVGLGPFVFEEYVPGSFLSATRFEDYYKDGLPYADKVVYQIMGDAAARDVAFRAGEIDVTLLNSTQYQVYSGDPALSKNLLEVAEAYTRHMGFNPAFEPFKDVRVRRAINHAINTDLIIEKFVKGKAYRATGWLPISSPAYAAGDGGYAYDPELAKTLLAEAGYADGFSVEVTTNESSSYGRPVMEAVLPFLAEVGIDISINVVENAVFQDKVFKQGDYQAYMYSVGSGPDPLGTLKCFHSETPHSACNYIDYNDPAYDALLDQAAAADSEEAQIAFLMQANAYLTETAPMWFFNYNKAIMAYQPWVHGLQPNAVELGLQNPESIWISADSPRADAN